GGNSLFVVEHDPDIVRHADWIVDIGPAAGEHGGQVLYSGPPEGLLKVANSLTARYVFDGRASAARTPREPKDWIKVAGVSRNNLHNLDAAFPIGLLTTVTGISGSGKSSLVSQALVELVAEHLGDEVTADEEEADPLNEDLVVTTQ